MLYTVLIHNGDLLVGCVRNLYHCLLLMFSLFYQEVLLWLTKLQKSLGGEVSDDKLRDFIWNTLKSGQVGHWFLLLVHSAVF